MLGNSQIGLDAITDGKADVFMNARNLGDALVKDIAGKRALLWIDGDRATIQKAADAFNNKADMVQKGTYPFMEKDYPTVRMWVALLAGSHVSDETVYKYVKAVAENEARVQDIGGSLKTRSPRQDGDQPRQPAVPPGRLALLQGKGPGEVALRFLTGRGPAPPGGGWYVFIQAARSPPRSTCCGSARSRRSPATRRSPLGSIPLPAAAARRLRHVGARLHRAVPPRHRDLHRDHVPDRVPHHHRRPGAGA